MVTRCSVLIPLSPPPTHPPSLYHHHHHPSLSRGHSTTQTWELRDTWKASGWVRGVFGSSLSWMGKTWRDIMCPVCMQVPGCRCRRAWSDAAEREPLISYFIFTSVSLCLSLSVSVSVSLTHSPACVGLPLLCGLHGCQDSPHLDNSGITWFGQHAVSRLWITRYKLEYR